MAQGVLRFQTQMITALMPLNLTGRECMDDLRRLEGDEDLKVEEVISTFGEGITNKRWVRVMLAIVVASDEDPRIKGWLRDFIRQVRESIGSIFEMLGFGVDQSKVALFHALVVGLAVLNLGRDDEPSRQETQSLIQLSFPLLLIEKK